MHLTSKTWFVEKNYNSDICSKIPTYIIKDVLKSFYKETKDKGIRFEFEKTEENDFWDKFRQFFYNLYKQLDIEVERVKREKNV